MSVKILIDSASDVDLNEAEELGAELISMKITFEDGEYSDGVDFTKRQFFERLIESAELPRTSQINPYQFEEAFETMTADGSDVVAITISSKLSGTYKSAVTAAKRFGGRVRVVDSLNASAGERALLLYALRLREQGKDADEIADELEKVKHRINVMAVLDTLLYLKKGGRISAMAAFAGGVLSVKPVIGVIGGEVKLVGKAIGSKKSNNLLNQLVREKVVDFSMPHCVIWSGLDDSLLKKYVEDSRALWADSVSQLPTHMIGSTIGTHIGPGAVGVAFFAKE